ncbi:MAG: ORF6N domain-containing protein [Candidatus Omnitrophota bacterium]|nr:ORF6N domain-containing protein [Candidatus Omnitrophota bacterium]MBU1928336.1 ORF6N domain-containing protein [Candidatus Omnitrophota bacterium]MBU2034347.1 ORF6N domain-containing protein [Candidatus Omnitrophota bacterium]MBU2222338.1 ORF6N domain-containing protein [Candidatus Omnitrophota bacterium]MBU2258125.1 ORF6N domain-containing protein [Candidatus Omnitrophota bacterium]
MPNLLVVETIAARIFEIRGKKVMIDRDLAVLYGVETRILNQAVRRNINRFPEDFMFSLTRKEIMNLSQNVISSNIKHAPNVFVFTQEGVAMLSGVLNSKRAVQVNIQIMRAFVKLRNILSANKQFAIKLRELEDRLNMHDKDISDIFEAIRQLVGMPDARKIIKGFAQK